MIYVNTAGRGFASYTRKRLISSAPGKHTQGRPGISSLPGLRFANSSSQRVMAPVPGKTQFSRNSGFARARAWLANGKQSAHPSGAVGEDGFGIDGLGLDAQAWVVCRGGLILSSSPLGTEGDVLEVFCVGFGATILILRKLFHS